MVHTKLLLHSLPDCSCTPPPGGYALSEHYQDEEDLQEDVEGVGDAPRPPTSPPAPMHSRSKGGFLSLFFRSAAFLSLFRRSCPRRLPVPSPSPRQLKEEVSCPFPLLLSEDKPWLDFVVQLFPFFLFQLPSTQNGKRISTRSATFAFLAPFHSLFGGLLMPQNVLGNFLFRRLFSFCAAFGRKCNFFSQILHVRHSRPRLCVKLTSVSRLPPAAFQQVR